MAYVTNRKNRIWAGGAGAFSHADTTELALAAGQLTVPGALACNDDGEAKLPGFSAGTHVRVVLEKPSSEGGSIADVYDGDNGDTVELAFPRSGELFNLVVLAANTTTQGALYTNDASGRLIGATLDGTDRILFECQETTAASAADRLVLFKKV